MRFISQSCVHTVQSTNINNHQSKLLFYIRVNIRNDVCCKVLKVCARFVCVRSFVRSVCCPWPSNREKRSKDEILKSTFFSVCPRPSNSFSGSCFVLHFTLAHSVIIFYPLRCDSCPTLSTFTHTLSPGLYDHCHMAFISVIFIVLASNLYLMFLKAIHLP